MTDTSTDGDEKERNPAMDLARAEGLDHNRRWAKEFGTQENQHRSEAAYQRHVDRVGYDPLAETDNGER